MVFICEVFYESVLIYAVYNYSHLRQMEAFKDVSADFLVCLEMLHRRFHCFRRVTGVPESKAPKTLRNHQNSPKPAVILLTLAENRPELPKNPLDFM